VVEALAALEVGDDDEPCHFSKSLRASRPVRRSDGDGDGDSDSDSDGGYGAQNLGTRSGDVSPDNVRAQKGGCTGWRVDAWKWRRVITYGGTVPEQ
jgi:hypothetical protein